MAADPKMLAEVKAFIERQGLEFTESEEQRCVKLGVRSGLQKASVSVFNTGSLSIQGPENPLKTLLAQMKTALEAGTVTPGQVLPFEIERFPEAILERVPSVDPVIIAFVREAIVCMKANALLGAAFMLGAASEKAISLLVHTYAESIGDDTARGKFHQRIHGCPISTKYNEFEKSYRCCKSRPTKESPLGHDLDVLIGQTFQFSRITRNEIGHPQVVPDLVRGVVIANLGQFVHYIDRVYQLMEHFKKNGVEV